MKNLFIILVCLFSISFLNASEKEETPIQTSINADDCDKYEIIKGQPCTLYLSGGYASGSYILHYPTTLPGNAVYQWSIVGSGRAYCYPNGTYCSINVYAAGSYRLLCDVYVNGSRIDGVTRYITVMP